MRYSCPLSSIFHHPLKLINRLTTRIVQQLLDVRHAVGLSSEHPSSSTLPHSFIECSISTLHYCSQHWAKHRVVPWGQGRERRPRIHRVAVAVGHRRGRAVYAARRRTELCHWHAAAGNSAHWTMALRRQPDQNTVGNGSRQWLNHMDTHMRVHTRDLVW